MTKLPRISKSTLHRRAFPYLMCLPAVILFTLFVILPFVEGCRVSFFKWDGFSNMRG